MQLNTNKSSDVLQNLLNDTKLVDYKFLFLIKLQTYINNNEELFSTFRFYSYRYLFFLTKITQKKS